MNSDYVLFEFTKKDITTMFRKGGSDYLCENYADKLADGALLLCKWLKADTVTPAMAELVADQLVMNLFYLLWNGRPDGTSKAVILYSPGMNVGMERLPHWVGES